nr:ATP-binding cassette domain-containing protein [Sneathiella glossodoripedis]
MALVSVKDLHISFKVNGREVPAVKHVSFDLNKGETLALVGESGSGKSITALSLLQLLPYPLASHPKGRILIDGKDIIGAPPEKMQKIRGNKISMIFQEPMTSLNPLHTIEKQINETLFTHKNMSKSAARERVIELLELVGLDTSEDRLNAYSPVIGGTAATSYDRYGSRQ